jgi:creatinine amidohydrolase
MSAGLLLFEEMTREALSPIAPSALVVVPVGSTEQHGPHLPAGTDAMHAEHVARAAAARIADRVTVVVAPTLAFGCSPQHLPFGATISLSVGTLARVLRDIGRSLASAGFRQLFIVNGHGGNHELIQLAARNLALELPICVAGGSWWAIAQKALVEAGAAADGRMPGHAGAFETSLMLALRPDLVKEPRPHRDNAATGDTLAFFSGCSMEIHGSWQQMDGYSDSPDRGSAEQGRRFLAAAIAAVADSMLRFTEMVNRAESGPDSSQGPLPAAATQERQP